MEMLQGVRVVLNVMYHLIRAKRDPASSNAFCDVELFILFSKCRDDAAQSLAEELGGVGGAGDRSITSTVVNRFQGSSCPRGLRGLRRVRVSTVELGNSSDGTKSRGVLVSFEDVIQVWEDTGGLMTMCSAP
jgi:hypothetical protein